LMLGKKATKFQGRWCVNKKVMVFQAF